MFLFCLLLIHYQSFFTVIFYHILTQGGATNSRAVYTLPIKLNKRLFTTAVHSGDNPAVNVIQDTAYENNTASNKFLDDYTMNQPVRVLWAVIGV